jgi:hypothetical protein
LPRSTARTPEQAIDRLVDQLRHVAACVTSQPLIADRSLRYVTFIPKVAPVQLRARAPARVIMRWIKHNFDIVRVDERIRDYHAATTAYIYQILDSTGNEIIAYHWHPAGASRVIHPHLHISSRVNPIPVGRGPDELALADLHIASGVVRLGDIVRFLIEELDIAPLRDDWRQILQRTDPEES